MSPRDCSERESSAFSKHGARARNRCSSGTVLDRSSNLGVRRTLREGSEAPPRREMTGSYRSVCIRCTSTSADELTRPAPSERPKSPGPNQSAAEVRELWRANPASSESLRLNPVAARPHLVDLAGVLEREVRAGLLRLVLSRVRAENCAGRIATGPFRGVDAR